MPIMRTNNPVVAIAIADLHLSLQAPACRAEEDWLGVQANYLKRVRDMADEHEVPVLCAGDIFDRCNTTPELVNFALDHLPKSMICVAGNHDLPNHRFADLYRSGYGVLENAGHIIDVSGSSHAFGNGWVVSGAAWGQNMPVPIDRLHNIALVHAYIWRKGCSHGGAPEGGHFKEWGKRLRGFDVAVFGDNHQRFRANAGGCRVLNCGTFLRRRLDEVEQRPAIGVIYSDGFTEQLPMDITTDCFVDQVADAMLETEVDMSAFLHQLDGLSGDTELDFQAHVRRYLRENETEHRVERVLLNAIS